MPSTTNIPLTTLSNGPHVFGPANMSNQDKQSVLTIDRTVANGLNSLTPATTIEILIEQSNDGGVTWFELVDGLLFGGLHPAFRGGGNATSDEVGCTFDPGTGRSVRVTITVTAGPVAVQGSLTTS